MRTAIFVRGFAHKISIGAPAFGVQCTEQKADKQEDKTEAHPHKGQCLHNKRVFLLIHQSVCYARLHWTKLVNRKQVKIDELCFGEHELDVAVFIVDFFRWNSAVEKVVAFARLEDFQVDQSLVLVELLG